MSPEQAGLASIDVERAAMCMRWGAAVRVADGADAVRSAEAAGDRLRGRDANDPGAAAVLAEHAFDHLAAEELNAVAAAGAEPAKLNRSCAAIWTGS